MVNRRRSPERPRPATINDVAVRAGVSVATVSRALRGFENVSEATRTRVERAASDLEYHIDRRASRLATGRHETVGIVVPRIDTWYFAGVLSGFESILGRHDDLLLVCVDDVEARVQLVAGSAPLRKRVDGLVFIDVLLEPAEVDELARSELRVVTVGQRTERYSSVTVDNRSAAAGITEHLLGLGHERIALITGGVGADLPYIVPTDRRDGFRDAMEDAACPVVPELVVDAAVGVTEGAEALGRLLAAGPSPTAVFAAADELAFGVIAEARRRGIEVPGGLSVVGFDDHPAAAALGLTTVHQDPYALGQAAASAFLDAARAAAPAPQHVVHDTSMVLRSSTAPPVRPST